MGSMRHGVGTAAEVALEHPPHRVGAAAGQLCDLDDRVTLGAQQDHLVAGAGGSVAGGLVAAFQLGLGGLVQRHAQRRSHDRPPLRSGDLTMPLINQDTQPLAGSI
jgi:hypothetical protein